MPKNLVCAIYCHPEAYPPTLNAIEQLSKAYDNIYLLYRPNLENKWQYPANVHLVSSGGQIMTVRQQAQLPTIKKVLLFLSFTLKLLQLKLKHKPHTVLVYDGIPLFAAFMVGKITHKPKVLWYHNHDVMDNKHTKFSIGWFAARFEEKAFHQLDIFSLPTNERKQYFKMEYLKGAYFCIPNYPSLAFYSRFWGTKKEHTGLKLIYQGSISKGHGIEEVILFIAARDNITLTLIGNANEEYRKEINELILKTGTSDKVQMPAPVNYAELPAITAQHDVGLAIHTPHNIIYATGGTASNKIYEYAALGLPVLYFDNEHYNAVLSKYNWAFATDLSDDSLQKQISVISDHIKRLPEAAITSFKDGLNYEHVFSPVKNFIENI